MNVFLTSISPIDIGILLDMGVGGVVCNKIFGIIPFYKLQDSEE